jgi:hypothetical protein
MPYKRKQKKKPIDYIVPNAIYRGIVTGYDHLLIKQPVYEEIPINNFNSNEDDPNDDDKLDNIYEVVSGSALNAIRIIKNLKI